MPLWPEALSIEVVGAFVCGGCSYLLYKMMRSEQSTLDAIKSSPELRCDNILSHSGQAMEAGMTAFVRGVVYPVHGNSLLSTLKSKPPNNSDSGSTSGQFTPHPVPGVVLQRTTTEMIMTQVVGIWSNNERVLKVESESVPFYIVDNHLRVEIRDPMKLSSVELQTVAESFEAPTGGFFASLFAMLQGFHSTGIKHTEEMLVNGTEVVGLGRLVLKSSGYCLEPDTSVPYIVSTHSKEQIINVYSSWIPFLKACFYITGCIASFVTIRMLYHHFKKTFDDWRLAAITQTRSLAISSAAALDATAIPDILSCVTCCKLRNCVLVPCAHVSVCLECVQKVDSCPVCRSNFSSVQPLIYS